MKSVLCYGDSNTWGVVPMTDLREKRRFDFYARWPGVVQQRLGRDWRVIDEGLPGRTTVWPDPLRGRHMSGIDYLQPCLESHQPLDVIIVMLGTNDLKKRFNVDAEDVGQGIELLIDQTRNLTRSQKIAPTIIVIGPPTIIEVGVFARIFAGAHAKSLGLPSAIGKYAQYSGAVFLDTSNLVSSSSVDGVHLEQSQHEILGRTVADLVMDEGAPTD